MHEVGAIVILQLLSCQKWPPATIFFARRRAIKKLVWGLLQVALMIIDLDKTMTQTSFAGLGK